MSVAVITETRAGAPHPRAPGAATEPPPVAHARDPTDDAEAAAQLDVIRRTDALTLEGGPAVSASATLRSESGHAPICELR